MRMRNDQLHVQTPALVVTVIKTTMRGVKTAVSLLIRPSFQLNNLGLEILVIDTRSLATTLWESLSATA